MAAHSSILVRRIPWTEEPGGLQSMGSQSQTQLKRLSMHASMHQGEGAEVFIHPLHQLSVEGYFLQVGQNSLSLLDSNGQRKFLGKELQVL